MEPSRTILVVDDLPMFRDLEALFLARAGRVLTAAGAREALEIVRRERPAVVVADLFMPQEDGAALCRWIREDPELRNVRVIILSSSELAADRARAVQAGADDVLAKPISRVTLLEAVSRFLRFSVARGLPRVELRAPVRIEREGDEAWGTARNLSRAGIFVESPTPMPPRTEVRLEFELPETAQRLRSTAQVVWTRDVEVGQPPGMGLRFLGLDGSSARSLEDYVYERAALPDAAAVRGAA